MASSGPPSAEQSKLRDMWLTQHEVRRKSRSAGEDDRKANADAADFFFDLVRSFPEKFTYNSPPTEGIVMFHNMRNNIMMVEEIVGTRKLMRALKYSASNDSGIFNDVRAMWELRNTNEASSFVRAGYGPSFGAYVMKAYDFCGDFLKLLRHMERRTPGKRIDLSALTVIIHDSFQALKNMRICGVQHLDFTPCNILLKNPEEVINGVYSEVIDYEKAVFATGPDDDAKSFSTESYKFKEFVIGFPVPHKNPAEADTQHIFHFYTNFPDLISLGLVGFRSLGGLSEADIASIQTISNEIATKIKQNPNVSASELPKFSERFTSTCETGLDQTYSSIVIFFKICLDASESGADRTLIIPKESDRIQTKITLKLYLKNGSQFSLELWAAYEQLEAEMTFLELVLCRFIEAEKHNFAELADHTFTPKNAYEFLNCGDYQVEQIEANFIELFYSEPAVFLNLFESDDKEKRIEHEAHLQWIINKLRNPKSVPERFFQWNPPVSSSLAKEKAAEVETERVNAAQMLPWQELGIQPTVELHSTDGVKIIKMLAAKFRCVDLLLDGHKNLYNTHVESKPLEQLEYGKPTARILQIMWAVIKWMLKDKELAKTNMLQWVSKETGVDRLLAIMLKESVGWSIKPTEANKSDLALFNMLKLPKNLTK